MTPGLVVACAHVMADRVVSMDVRLAIVSVVQAKNVGIKVPIKEFCTEQQITPKTFYELRRRYLEGGLEAMLPRSRRPHHSPTATAPEMVAAVLERRLARTSEGLDAGARSIRWSLQDDGWDVPSERTIHRLLVTHGLVEPQPRKRPRSSYKRFASPWANGRWQMDGHERKLADHTTAVVLRVQDDCSRQIMATLVARTENTTDAWACVQIAIKRHGAPAMFLTDNGTAFSQRRVKHVMSEFESRLRGEGIVPITSSIAHPQTCGKKEREWQTLDRWLAVRPVAATLEALQAQLDAYDLMFNHERRHQALAGLTPAQRYDQAEKASPASHPLPTPAELRRVPVWANGAVSLGHGQTISIGREWAHTIVDVLREDPTCAIFYDRQLLELFQIDPDRRHQTRARR